MVFRAYNHGLAFRFLIPDQPGLESVRLLDEAFRFCFIADPMIWAGEASGKEKPESHQIRGVRLSRLKNESAAFPLLMQLESAGWMAFTTEAVPTAKVLILGRDAETIHTLNARVGSRKKTESAAIRLSSGRSSPWRILLLGDAPDRILEPDFIRDFRSGNGIDSARN